MLGSTRLSKSKLVEYYRLGKSVSLGQVRQGEARLGLCYARARLVDARLDFVCIA